MRNILLYILIFIVSHCYSQDKYTIEIDQDKWGVVDSENKIIIPFKYERIRNIQDTLFIVTESETGKFNIPKTGIIDYKNKVIVPIQYQLLGYNSFGMILSNNISCGVLKFNNEIVIPFQYEHIDYATIKNYYKIYNNKKYGIHDRNKLTIPVIYDNIKELGYVLLVKKENKYGIFNYQGDKLLSVRYDKIEKVNDSLFIALLNKEYYLITHNDLIINEIGYEKIYENKFNLFLVIKNGKKGAINSKGKEIINPVYDYVTPMWGNKFFIVKKDNKYGIVDSLNKVTVPIKYELIEELNYFDSSIAKVYHNGKYGVLNVNNEEILPIQYDEIMTSYKSSNIIRFKKDNKYGLKIIDSKEILPVIYDNIKECNHPDIYKIEINNVESIAEYMKEQDKIVITRYDDLKLAEEQCLKEDPLMPNKPNKSL